MSAPASLARVRHDPARVLWAVAGGSWVLLVVLAVLVPGLAHHHRVVGALESGQDAALVLGVFAAAWLVMVAAMMLPSTVPMVQMHYAVTAGVGGRTQVRTVFLTAYFVIWLAFAGAAL